MWYTNMYSNIIVYQKYLGTSIKVGSVTRSGPKAEGLPTNNQRGRRSGPCRLLQGPSYSYSRFVCRVQRVSNNLYKAE